MNLLLVHHADVVLKFFHAGSCFRSGFLFGFFRFLSCFGGGFSGSFCFGFLLRFRCFLFRFGFLLGFGFCFFLGFGFCFHSSGIFSGRSSLQGSGSTESGEQ